MKITTAVLGRRQWDDHIKCSRKQICTYIHVNQEFGAERTNKTHIITKGCPMFHVIFKTRFQTNSDFESNLIPLILDSH